MAGEPGGRFEKAALWVLFILPTLSGFLTWKVRDRDPLMPVMAISAWGCGALFALLIIFDHYRRPPDGR